MLKKGFYLLCLSLLACIPFFYTQRSSAIDGTLHLLRLVALDFHVTQGLWYPDWLPELAAGYGYPLLHFYSPSTYYLAEIFHLAGLSHTHALVATYLVLTFIASVGIYRLCADLIQHPTDGLESDDRGTWLIPLAVSALYLFTPYFLINVYMRGALGETGAQALLPWVFWSFRRLLYSPAPTRYIFPAMLSLGLLALTHTITLVFTAPLLLLYLCCGLLWAGTIATDAQAPRKRIGLIILSLIAAAGWSAFFWLPALFERKWIASYAFEFARGQVADNAWRWSTIINWHLPFAYAPEQFYRVGILQLLLALVGYFCWTQRTWEWRFWGVVTALTALGITQPFVPIWQNVSFLLMAQFPWRLLTILSLPLALMSGGILLRWRRWQLNWLLASLMLAGVMLAHRVPVAAIPQLDVNEPGSDLNLAAIPQFEFDTNAIGLGSAREFMPRWAKEPTQLGSTTALTNSAQEVALSPLAIQIQQATPFELSATITATKESPLRLATYYFPGWQASSGQQLLQPYPDTQTGLLTLDLPVGSHQLHLKWQGTLLQWWAVRCSLLTLFAIGLLLLYFAATSKANEQSRFRFPLGLQSLFLIGLGTVGLWRQATVPQIPTFHPSQSSVAVESLELLGYTSQQSDATSLYLFPYWHVRAPLPGLRAIWSIRDGAGKILSESEANPYFNTLSSQQLPDQAIFDDAYLLPLPPGLQAGSYHLFLQLHDSEVTDRFLTPAVDVGAIDLPATPPSAAPPVDFMPLALSFQGNLYLDGYTQRSLGDASRSVLGQAAYPLYYAGDTLDLTLYWRSRGIVSENYHSFVHLLNWEGNPLLKIDHLPGSIAHYPRTWNDLYPVPDPYHFTIPDTLPSGLYRPLLGLYTFNRPAERLVATAEDGTKTGDILLPPVKIVGKVSTQPRQTLQGIIGAFATFQGFSIEPETLILRPAQTFTLTFFYQAQQPASESYTRFVHLHSQASGMAAQSDSLPQGGANPTSAWVAGETVADTLSLQVGADVAPGRYRLLWGMYDQNANRVPLTNADDSMAQDNVFVLGEIEVVAGQ